VHYFFVEPYRCYKKYIFKDLSQFLIDIDKSNFNIESYFNELDKEKWSEVTNFFNERDKLGFAGKLEFDPIEKESLFRERENSNFIIKA
jgi:hypothetical protein